MLFPELAGFLQRAAAPAVLLLDDSTPGFAEGALAQWGEQGRFVEDVPVRLLSDLRTGDDGLSAATVVILVKNRLALRKGIFGLAALGRSRTVVCAIEQASAAFVVRPRPEWPTVTRANARLVGDGSMTVLRFSSAVPVRSVLEELARQAVDDRPTGHGGMVVAYGRCSAPFGVETGARSWEAVRDGLTTEVVPPEVVVLAPHEEAPPALRPTEVTGRAPALVRAPAIEPWDELVINPRGFLKAWEFDDAVLRPDGCLQRPAGEVVPLHEGGEAAVAAARPFRSLKVEWSQAEVRSQARLVAGLALAGVPLIGAPPLWAVALLGEALAELLGRRVDLADPLRREEHSVRLRRAALASHSVRAWRGDVAARAGSRFSFFPSVTAVLATKRPAFLDFALEQLADQREVGAFEVIVAAHGFEADRSAVHDRLGGISSTTLSFPRETVFGDVLEGARRVARGDLLLKVDDDDWYGPHFVHDLLAARHYARADVVGTPAEYLYLEERNLTMRREFPTEVYRQHVAGGTILTDRTLLHEIGGFRPVLRSVDAQLLRGAIDAGARIYRAQGLGYVLRRAGEAHGHTWMQDESEMWGVATARQWEGFAPSALLGDLTRFGRETP